MSVHDSLAETPQPSACSTETKQSRQFSIPTNPVQVKLDVKRNLMDMNVSTESLGILSLDDMKPTKDSLTSIHNPATTSTIATTSSTEARQQVLESTRALLAKFANRKNSSSLTESTVNESDLQMTPSKGSTINESDLLNKSTASNVSVNQARRNSVTSNTSSLSYGDSISAYISELQHQLGANSTATLSDIIGNKSKQSFELDSGMFQCAEEMKQQLDEDEKALRKKYAALPNATQASFNNLENISAHFDEKVSMGEFFKQKSDICSLFKTSSPKRKPIALVNSTAIEDDTKESTTLNESVLSAINQSIASVLSLSQIQGLITGDENTPNKVIEKLIKAPLQINNTNSSKMQQSHINQTENAPPVLLKDGYFNSRSSLGSPSLSSVGKLSKFASSTDLRTPTKESMASSTKIYTARSLSSINDNKENMMSPRRLEEKNRTLNSCRSTSSMDSIPDGIAKLASTKCEMVWGCIKEGRAVSMDITIRNKNNRRVKFMINTSNSNFKLTNMELQGDKAILLLHPLETRQLFISCSPNAIGPQTGNLVFTPIVRKEEQLASRQQIAMYAYGGHVNIQIKGQTRDLAGKLWVSLGPLDGRYELIADFVIRNSGTIDGFVSLTVNSKSLCAYDDISLTPSKVIIKRGSETNVRVRFRPSKNDLQLLNQALSNKSMKASEIAVIKMISGADINRQRINKISKKIPKEYEYNMQDPLAQQLNAPYQNATRGEDIRYFNESVKSVKSLMQTLDCTEISLLVDRDMDATLMPEADDSTVLFKTMISPDDSELMDNFAEHSYLKSFKVEPDKVILTPPAKCADHILLNTTYDRPVQFRVSISPEGPVRISPRCGMVRPGETVMVKVECEYGVTMARQDFEVLFEIEDEALKSKVSVLNL